MSGKKQETSTIKKHNKSAQNENKIQPEVKNELIKVIPGFVNDCMRLNVRKTPSRDADVVAVLNFRDEVSIVANENIEGWVAIQTADGMHGFCVKQFIATE